MYQRRAAASAGSQKNSQVLSRRPGATAMKKAPVSGRFRDFTRTRVADDVRAQPGAFSFAWINAEPPRRRDRKEFSGFVSASRRHGDETCSGITALSRSSHGRAPHPGRFRRQTADVFRATLRALRSSCRSVECSSHVRCGHRKCGNRRIRLCNRCEHGGETPVSFVVRSASVKATWLVRMRR